MSTEEVLTHHLEAFAAGDVDALMADYTDESIVMVPDATHRGVDEIRAMFDFAFANLFIPESYEFTMGRVEVEGEIAFIVWEASSERFEVPFGTDTFVVRDGKIVVQTFAAHVVLKR